MISLNQIQACLKGTAVDVYVDSMLYDYENENYFSPKEKKMGLSEHHELYIYFKNDQ